MNDGEDLYDAVLWVCQQYGLSLPFSPYPPELWERVAVRFLMGRLAVPPIRPDRINWRDELKKYGRHLPGCPTGAPCNCGFAEIEKELA